MPAGTELTYDYNFHSFNVEKQVKIKLLNFIQLHVCAGCFGVLWYPRIGIDSSSSIIISLKRILLFLSKQLCKCGFDKCRGIIGGKSQRMNGLSSKTNQPVTTHRRPGRSKEKRKSKHKLKKRVSTRTSFSCANRLPRSRSVTETTCACVCISIKPDPALEVIAHLSPGHICA